MYMLYTCMYTCTCYVHVIHMYVHMYMLNTCMCMLYTCMCMVTHRLIQLLENDPFHGECGRCAGVNHRQAGRYIRDSHQDIYGRATPTNGHSPCYRMLEHRRLLSEQFMVEGQQREKETETLLHTLLRPVYCHIYTYMYSRRRSSVEHTYCMHMQNYQLHLHVHM